jgi:flagellar biosynthesis/type III secretory pathway chaperone
MMDRNAPVDRLQGIVADELAAVHGLLDILGRERAALLARDADVLVEISSCKADAVARAADLGQQRRMLLQESPGLGQAGLGAALAQLRQLALECRQQNEANGLLIRGYRRRIEAALGILRGGRPGVDLYGRDGAATQLRLQSRGPLAAW